MSTRRLTVSIVLAVSVVSTLPSIAATVAPCEAAARFGALLRATDPGYADAAWFAKFLESNAIHVDCMTSSKIGNLFLGRGTSANIQTDRGPITAIFLPEEKGAEELSVRLTVHHDHYRYVFSDSILPWAKRETMEMDAPMHFLIHDRMLVIAWDVRVEEPLRRSLVATQCPGEAPPMPAVRVSQKR